MPCSDASRLCRRETWPRPIRSGAPTEEYTFKDFLQDWGDGGYYGRVRSFRIVKSESQGSGVIVRVQIRTDEGQLRLPIAFWVGRKDRTIGFAPSEF